MRWILLLFILCLMMPACTKSRNTAGPAGKPGLGAPPGAPPKAPVATPAPAPAPGPGATPGAPPSASSAPGQEMPPKAPNVPTSDGPALATLLTGMTAMAAHAGKVETRVDNPEVIKALLKAINTSQNVKGNRKGCSFQYNFVLQGASGKEVATLGLCSPVGANNAAVFGDAKQREWQLTIPDGSALAALLDKHLPGAKVK